MKRTARIILVLAAITALAAPAIGGAALNLFLVRLDACFPTATKQANPAKVLFVTDTCTFTYQGQHLWVQGVSEGLQPDDSSEYSGGVRPAPTKVTVMLKRGTNVLLSCSGQAEAEGFDWIPATCFASKQIQASIPLGAQLTCTAQAKDPYDQPVRQIGAQGKCFSFGSPLF